MTAHKRSFAFHHVGNRILAVVGMVVTLGLAVLVLFYTDRQERNILAQNERALMAVTESVMSGLKTVMQAGYADIGETMFDRLEGVGTVVELRIMRMDGSEAFHDNLTIDAVNGRLKNERFHRREIEKPTRVLDPDDKWLKQVLILRQSVSHYHAGPNGERHFTLLTPVLNQSECWACHGAERPVRGVLKLTSSLESVYADIERTWLQSIGVLGAAIVLTLATVALMMRSSVVRPIRSMTKAMMRASRGDLSHEVPVLSQDELGQMANSFNAMMKELKRLYSGLRIEQNKLSTIILGAQEGMVVTDRAGQVALVNPAASVLLGKSPERIVAEGFLQVLDNPEWVAARQHRVAEAATPDVVEYGDRVFSVLVGSINNDDGKFIGAAMLIRDITEELRLQTELRRLSDTDGLTGLYNRRYFDQRLSDEFSLSRRYGKPLAVFLFDVDHFKKFNDTYGHDQGDRVLQAMGVAMRETADPTQVCCRYGGEEFVAILPNTDSKAAAVVAERLRAHVEAMQVDGLSVTISIGVAAMPPRHPAHPPELLKDADSAMYAAKDAGRNQVREATADPAAG